MLTCYWCGREYIYGVPHLCAPRRGDQQTYSSAHYNCVIHGATLIVSCNAQVGTWDSITAYGLHRIYSGKVHQAIELDCGCSVSATTAHGRR